MNQIEITASRRKFICTSKDKIMFNGKCYILYTQTMWVEWSNVFPTISKTEFNRLKKLGILSEPYPRKMSYSTVMMYDFKLD